MNWLWGVLGLVGVFLHMLTKVDCGEDLPSIKKYFKQHLRTTIMAVVSYMVVVLIWYTEGFQFLGLLAGKLNAMTLIFGYSAQSLLGHVVGRVEQAMKRGQ